MYLSTCFFPRKILAKATRCGHYVNWFPLVNEMALATDTAAACRIHKSLHQGFWFGSNVYKLLSSCFNLLTITLLSIIWTKPSLLISKVRSTRNSAIPVLHIKLCKTNVKRNSIWFRAASVDNILGNVGMRPGKVCNLSPNKIIHFAPDLRDNSLIGNSELSHLIHQRNP